MTMQNYVEGKVIVITGAGGGFGKLLSEKSAAMGARVVCAGRHEENIKSVVEGIRANGYEASYIKTDVSVKADVDAMAQFAIKQYGRIDVLVNNAGTMPLAFFWASISLYKNRYLTPLRTRLPACFLCSIVQINLIPIRI